MGRVAGGTGLENLHKGIIAVAPLASREIRGTRGIPLAGSRFVSKSIFSTYQNTASVNLNQTKVQSLHSFAIH